MKNTLIAINTTRYSELFRRLLEHYRGEGCELIIDGVKHQGSDFPKILEDWCVNARIVKTKNCVLKKKDQEIFGFHDHPGEMWGAVSELSFVEQLASEKIIRFQMPKS